MLLDIEKILRNENKTIRISSDSLSKTHTLFYEGEINIGGSNEFGTPFAANQAQGVIADTINAASQTANQFIGTDFDVIRLEHIRQTKKMWQSSGEFSLRVKVHIIALRAGDDVRIVAKELLKATYPKVGIGVGFNGKKVEIDGIGAPFGYKLKDDGAVGTVTIEIGRWLKIPNLLISSVNFSFSDIPTSNGTPLYASGEISFVPFKMVSDTDLDSYLGVF